METPSEHTMALPDKTEREPETEKDPFDLKKEIFEWFDAIIFWASIMVLLFSFVFRVVSVDGPSMESTLYTGERLIISHLFYTPKQGDIIVETQPNAEDKPLIKRIIALGGQTIDIDDLGNVLVDGVKIEEDYVNEAVFNGGNRQYPYTVKEGEVFVMGDNRNHSLDSRSTSIGTVDVHYILGKAYFRILPLGRFGFLK